MCYNKKDYLHRVEDDPRALLEYVGGSTEDIFDDKKYNTYRRNKNWMAGKWKKSKLTINDIDKYKDEFIKISSILGYDILEENEK